MTCFGDTDNVSVVIQEHSGTVGHAPVPGTRVYSCTRYTKRVFYASAILYVYILATL